jgi:hypothetical protein
VLGYFQSRCTIHTLSWFSCRPFSEPTVWHHPWGGHCGSTVPAIGWPSSPTPSVSARWAVGTSYLRALLGLPLQKLGLHCQTSWHASPLRGDHPSNVARGRHSLKQRHIELMLGANPPASHEDLLLFSLCNVFHQLFGGTPLSPPRSPHGRFLFGLTYTTSARELRRALLQPPRASEFMGMMVPDPTSFHDILSDDDLLSEGSSVSNLSPLGCPMLWECTMVDMQGRQPVPVETEDTHTPPDPRVQAMANA